MTTQNDNVLNSARTSRCKAVLRFGITLFLTIAILMIIFFKVNFYDVLTVLKQTDIQLLFLGILCSIFAHVIFSSSRYQKIVYSFGCHIPFSEAVIIRMGCNPIKGIFPFKMGEFTILAYMKKKHNLSYPLGLFSLLLGYIYSFIVLVLFYSFGGVFYFYDFSQKIIFALMFMIVLFLIATSKWKKIFRFINWYAIKFQKSPEALALFREKFDVAAIRNVFPHSMGIEGFKLLIIFVLFKSLHIQIPLDALLFLGSTTIITAYIPITYWGMGIRESAVLFLFSHYATPDRLLAGSLLVTLVDGILPALLGLLFIKPFLNSLWDDI